MAKAKKAPVVKSVIIEGAPVIERAIVRFSHIVLQFTVENGDQISYEVLETLENPEVADAIEYATVRFSEVVCQFVVTDGTTVHAYELEPVYQEIGGGPTPPVDIPTFSNTFTLTMNNDHVCYGRVTEPDQVRGSGISLTGDYPIRLDSESGPLSEYYPIAIPEGKTGVKITSPDLDISISEIERINNEWIRKTFSGWLIKQSSAQSYTFQNSTTTHILMALRVEYSSGEVTEEKMNNIQFEWIGE